jgi:hypothetical protein
MQHFHFSDDGVSLLSADERRAIASGLIDDIPWCGDAESEVKYQEQLAEALKTLKAQDNEWAEREERYRKFAAEHPPSPVYTQAEHDARWRSEPPIDARPEQWKLEKPASASPPVLKVLDVGDDDQPIEPRQWLLGNAFCRQFVSGLIAPGAGAKTSLRIAQTLSLTSGRELTGEEVFVRCKVLIICLEDGMTELRRRVRAAMIYHGVKREDVKGWLFLTTPQRLKMAQRDPKTGAAVTGDLDSAIRAFIDKNKIDLVTLDPIKKAHGLEENSNDDMDVLVTIMAQLAIEKNIAVDFLSHERKGGGEAGDINRARGASSMKDGGRLMYTNTWMTSEEAEAFNLTEEQRRLLLRVDSAKVNIAPPSATTQWFRLVNVDLGNGNDTYPNGDRVQTVEPWIPPTAFEGFSTVDLNRALDKLGAGMGDGRRYSTASAATARAAWRVLQEICPTQSEKRCRDIVKIWVKNKMLIVGTYYDEQERKDRDGVTGAKRIGEKI